MSPSLLLPFLACSGPSAAPPASPTPEPALVAPPAPDLATDLEIVPDAIRWDGADRTLSVEAHLTGGSLATRSEVVHVGVTVVTETNAEVDLIVHTLFPGAFDQVVWFSTELAEAPKHVLIGAWNTKIEPCDVDRPGCKEFGFVLDGSLAAFPAGLYTEGMRQRFLPETYAITVSGDATGIAEAASRYASIFGGTVDVRVDATVARDPGVWVAQADDLGLAHAIATSQSPPLPYGVAEELPGPLVVVLPQ